MIYIEMTLDSATEEQVFSSFGGRSQMAEKLSDIMKEMGHK